MSNDWESIPINYIEDIEWFRRKLIWMQWKREFEAIVRVI